MNEPKLFQIFKNSFVYVLPKSLRVSQNRESTHIVIQGFLTDFCEEYYYFSIDPMGDITDSIRRDDVIRMFLPIDELTEMLQSHGNNEDLN